MSLAWLRRIFQGHVQEKAAVGSLVGTDGGYFGVEGAVEAD